MPDGEPQHEQRLPLGPEFRWKEVDAPEILDGTDHFPVQSSVDLRSIGKI
jgi:hypothetical protein